MAGGQSPAPASTYRIHADGAVKEPGDHKFAWKVAPDNSLAVLIVQPNGRWTVKRLTRWQTPAPKEQTATFSDPIPDRERNSFVWFDDPLIDPEGRYILAHRRTDLKHLPPGGRPGGTDMVALLDLRTLRLVYQKKGFDLRGNYLFAPSGALLHFFWTNDSRFLHGVDELTLPDLKAIASCNYNEKFMGSLTGHIWRRRAVVAPPFCDLRISQPSMS